MTTGTEKDAALKTLYDSISEVDRTIVSLLQKRSELSKQILTWESLNGQSAAPAAEQESETSQARSVAAQASVSLQNTFATVMSQSTKQKPVAGGNSTVPSDADAGALYMAMSFNEW